MGGITKAISMGVFWSLTAFDGLLLALRLRTRLRIYHKFRSDDYALIFAYIVLLAGGGIYVWMIDTFVDLLPFEEGYATADTYFPPLAHKVGVVDLVYDVIFVSANWAVKLSFLLFLRRILQPIPGYLKWWWLCTGAWAAMLLGNYLSVIWLCKQARGNGSTTQDQCSNTTDRRFLIGILTYSCATDIAIDILIIILPYPLISQLKKITWRQKIGLYCVFSLAFITIALASFRIAYQLGVTTQRLNHMSGYFVTWMEVLISICMGCIPGLIPIMRRRSMPPVPGQLANFQFGQRDVEADPGRRQVPPMRERQAKRKSRDPWEITAWFNISSRRGSATPQTAPAVQAPAEDQEKKLGRDPISEASEPQSMSLSMNSQIQKDQGPLSL
ncbi:hypothetical protein H072_2395 [Dactylellina haptotyla CBS 200.50]|uniref:Rhodopsin domain-containing protein n=1 Tax=Dactylellina haptotyla (strain CBS 200.50) TaxID=1284197 RepID=S8AL04_DACHA|nr:hypothetical protein H072_2395 [Dactylellina haptotyla CBS 200.50]